MSIRPFAYPLRWLILPSIMLMLTAPVKAQPANDLCSNAQLIQVELLADCPGNAVTGTTELATQDGGTAGCETDPGPYLDVWYQFNSGANLSVTIDVQPITALDWVLVVLDACNGNEVLCEITPFDPVEMAVAPGIEYWVRIYSLSTFPGSFSLCVSGAAASGGCEAGTIAGNGATALSICKDGLEDVVLFSTTSTSLEEYAYILADDADLIIAQLPGSSYDMDLLATATYHIWGISYNGALTGLVPGQPVSGIGTTGACIELSLPITATVELCSGIAAQGTGSPWIRSVQQDGELVLIHDGLKGRFELSLIDAAGCMARSTPVSLEPSVPLPLAFGHSIAKGVYTLLLSNARTQLALRVVLH